MTQTAASEAEGDKKINTISDLRKRGHEYRLQAQELKKQLEQVKTIVMLKSCKADKKSWINDVCILKLTIERKNILWLILFG